jgi:pectinesterase
MRAKIWHVTFLWHCLCVVTYADDIVVDPSGGQGTFQTVQAALKAVPAGSAQNRSRILLKPGIYTEQITIPQNLRYLSLIGQGTKPEDVVLTFNLSAKSTKNGGGVVGTSGSSSVFINANDFAAENLTFANSMPPRVAQAVAIKPQADRLAFLNCRFLGFQDTLYPCKGRQYYKDCFITGTVDFIFGDATAVFDHCIMESTDKGYLTAPSTAQKSPYGLVFLDCTLTATAALAKQKPSVYLGRPWRPDGSAAFIRCRIGPHIYPVGWDNWRNEANEKTARFAEFGSVDLDGKALDVSKRVAWSRQLSFDQVKEYTLEKILGGPDRWDPSFAFAAKK